MTLGERVRSDIDELTPEQTRLRHDLHRIPEVGLDLPRTQRAVLDELDGLGLEISTGTALTSITAVLRGGAAGGPTVLLRGDMDALPVTEATGVEFASTIDGAMHACGHDLHTTMLVGAARVLAAHRTDLPGDVVFMFQPGEEGWDGAGAMLAEGVLDASGRRADSAYGIHVSSGMPRGVFTTRPGTLMAASDRLHVTVRGAGGHGSTPFLTRDPVSVAAQLVGDLQTLVTRRFDVFDPVVVTVGYLHAGTKRNIIPDEAEFDATVRTFSPAARERIREESVRLCEQVAAGYGLDIDARFTSEYPVTVNDAVHAEFAAGVAREVFGEDGYEHREHPLTGAEDFSRVLAEVPGCYTFLGACVSEEWRIAPSNHSPRAAFDDAVLPLGVRLHCELAVRALERDAGGAAVQR